MLEKNLLLKEKKISQRISIDILQNISNLRFICIIFTFKLDYYGLFLIFGLKTHFFLNRIY
jgi:hypothetical protein